MASVRARIALIAAITTALAVALAGVLLLWQLQSSLQREFDESLERQVFNFELEVDVYEDFETVPLPNDEETLLIVVEPDGFAPVTNDGGVSGIEVASALELSSQTTSELQFADISLRTPTETTNPESFRAAFVEIYLDDQQIDEQFFLVMARSDGQVDRTVQRVRNGLLAGVPGVAAFVAALAWWLTGRSLRPVDQMRREVDEISSTDLARRVSEPESNDEVAALATTMNRMLGRLEHAQATQEQFVNDAAHELRTPLTSIAAQIDVDAAHPESADLAATAANVRGEVTRLQSLIGGLLASARNQGKAQPATETLLDLDVIAIEAAARAAVPSHLSLGTSGIGAGAVRGDETALSSLVDNLIANACRHATSAVAVGVGTDAAGVWLSVDDDGGGIAPADRERVFGRFVRLDEARSRDVGGSGLGLALARETAARHGGTLHVAESAIGGAQFVLRLPAALG